MRWLCIICLVALFFLMCGSDSGTNGNDDGRIVTKVNAMSYYECTDSKLKAASGTTAKNNANYLCQTLGYERADKWGTSSYCGNEDIRSGPWLTDVWCSKTK